MDRLIPVDNSLNPVIVEESVVLVDEVVPPP